MKTLLTILFFTDTLVLIVLSFFLFKWIDNGTGGSAFIFFLIAYGACIFLLGFLLMRYINLPVDQNMPKLLNQQADGNQQ